MGGLRLSSYSSLTVPSNLSANRLFHHVPITEHQSQLFPSIPLGVMEESFVQANKWPHLAGMITESGHLHTRKDTSTFTTKIYVASRKRTPNYFPMSIHPNSILLLTERWLNLLSFNWNFFPDTYLAYRADRMSSEKTRGGGTFIPASDSVSGFYVEVTWKWLRNVFCLKYLLPMALIYVSATTVLILTQFRTH